MKKVLAVAVVSMAALTAQAGIEADFVLVGQGPMEPGGEIFNIHELRVTTDTDWTNSRLEIRLSVGSFGNHARQNADGAPPLAASLGTYPELANDSYLQTPDGRRANIAGPPVFPQAAPSGDTEIAISWFDTADTGAGTFTIAQIALTKDAWGTVEGRNYDIETAGVGVDIGVIEGVPIFWSLVDGHIFILPEPAALSLLAVGAAVMLKNKPGRK